MTIRKANINDAEGILKLLQQVAEIHHRGRPDIFRQGAQKYNRENLADILADSQRPVLVAVDAENSVLGYAFCVIHEVQEHPLLMDDKYIYIDDLCVEEEMRGQHIGKALLDAVRDYARAIGCRRLTLNVWACNPSARAFYDKNGFTPLETTLEQHL